MPSSIAIKGLAKRYGAFVALDDVSLVVEPGELLTLLGPSGSGKTTLLMSIAGFTKPDAGSILVDGREIVALAPHKRNIGMVFQSYALFPHMSVAENVGYPLKLRGVGQAARDQRIRTALAAVRMERFADRGTGQLSGGQRQRVAVARAIVFEPNIILMDEPLSALDKNLREEMQVELKHLQARLERTVVYVTHDQREALTISDRVAVMRLGRIEQIASPRAIYEAPATRFVASFIGDTNFVPASALMADPRGQNLSAAFVERELGGRRAPLVVMRPEKLEFVENGARVEGAFRTNGTVREILFHGDAVVAYVVLETGHAVRVQRGTRQSAMANFPRPGDPVSVMIREADACVVEDDETSA